MPQGNVFSYERYFSVHVLSTFVARKLQMTIQSILSTCQLILNVNDDNKQLHSTCSVPDSVLNSLYTFAHLSPHHKVYAVDTIMIFILQVTIEP